MTITNIYNVPETVVRALDWHTHRKAFLSASETSLSPRQFWLKERHKGEVVEDVSERIWALLGTAVHYILEKGSDKQELSEEYLTTEIAGETVSGITDLYNDGKISDYKITSVWAYIYRDKPGSMDSYTTQLNTDAYLYRKAAFEVNELEIVMILRDWQKRDAVKENYPNVQIQVVPIPLWSMEEQERFLADKVNLFKSFQETPDDALPECSEAERWYSGTEFKVYKKGLKRALNGGTFNSEGEACDFANRQEFLTMIKKIPGESKKCSYCIGRTFCNQWKKENE